MAAALFFGARHQQGRRGVVDADEREHQPRRIVGGQLLVEHHLFGDRHSAAPLARPVGNGVARAVQRGEPRLLESHEFLVGGAGLSLAPIARNVVDAPRAHLAAETELVQSESAEFSLHIFSFAAHDAAARSRSIACATATPSSNEGVIWVPVRSASAT